MHGRSWLDAFTQEGQHTLSLSGILCAGPVD
jgi:hypothetical protein